MRRESSSPLGRCKCPTKEDKERGNERGSCEEMSAEVAEPPGLRISPSYQTHCRILC